ncbi:hypothetical protein F4803DRAFT_550061 [Xylaria telfairii]|nr:hypothetical protein F4803DRAFT_550061 [Xylaria telfairii]
MPTATFPTTNSVSQSTTFSNSRNISNSGIPSDPSSPNRLNGGTIMGIVVAVVAAISLFALLLWFIFHYRRMAYDMRTKATNGPGRFEKAELGASGNEIRRRTPLLELSARRETRELGTGDTVPIELEGSGVPPAIHENEGNDDSLD